MAVYIEDTQPAPEEIIQPDVDIKNFAFNPETLSIQKGTTIMWSNKDNVVTSDIFDSGKLGKGESFSYTFDQAGTFEYRCTIHPYMKGKIIVT